MKNHSWRSSARPLARELMHNRMVWRGTCPAWGSKWVQNGPDSPVRPMNPKKVGVTRAILRSNADLRTPPWNYELQKNRDMAACFHTIHDNCGLSGKHSKKQMKNIGFPKIQQYFHEKMKARVSKACNLHALMRFIASVRRAHQIWFF